MKTATIDREVETTIRGEKIAMSIDFESLPQLMDVFIDLYEDSEAAIIREISTNARDAHVEAGTTNRAIEITLPTDLAPFFRVKDYGCGLSKQDIINIYSKYGASTKRDTNDQTGALGLGCKSPLTYTDQFTLVSAKDGIRIQMAVSRDTVGASMTVLDETETDEENGTEVIIPAKRYNRIADKCAQFFRFWEPGIVLVNGEQPLHFTAQPGVQKVTDTLYIVPGTQDYIIMANVAYPASGTTAINHGMAYGRSLVAFVGPTEIDHSKPREGLRDTQNTLDTIQYIREEFEEEMVDFIQKLIDAEPTHVAGLKKMLEWKGFLPRLEEKGTSYTYKGQDIPSRYEEDGMIVLDKSSSKLSAHSRGKYLNVEHFTSTVFVHGYDRASFTAGQKKKLLHWLEDEDGEFNSPDYYNITRFVLVQDAPDNEFIPGENIVEWATIQAIKLPRIIPVHRGGTGRIPGSYDICEDGVWRDGVPADEINTSYPLFWVYSSDRYTYTDILSRHFDNYTLVVLTSNRVEKFMRNFPAAKPVRDGAIAAYGAWVKTITQADITALSVHDSAWEHEYASLDPARVDDPELKTAIVAAKRDLQALKLQRNTFQRLLNRGIVQDIPEHKTVIPDRYPLINKGYYGSGITGLVRSAPDDFYEYINAKYAKIKSTLDTDADAQ